MPKVYNAGQSVFEAAKERLRAHYAAGDRVVVSISGGKDSTVVMELALQVAQEENRLPVECIMRDEEIMVPGTFEYLERVYQRPDVHLHWVIAGQAIINAFNRWSPYWWVFDPLVQDLWVRQPPPQAQWIADQNIGGMTSLERFPVNEGKRLISVIGLRTQESLRRMNRIASSKGALTKHPTDWGAYNLAPIYDWTDEDVWKAIGDFRWDYNEAYNRLFRAGVPRRDVRIAPPSMAQGMIQLPYIARIWPKWFDRVDQRLGGLKLAAKYGRRAIKPQLRPGETWQDVTYRQLEEARERGADWLVKRAEFAIKKQLTGHAHHSTVPLPMTHAKRCEQCPPPRPGSWQGLAESLWNGDPWATQNQCLEALEQWELREGAKSWFPEGKKGSLTF